MVQPTLKVDRVSNCSVRQMAQVYRIYSILFYQGTRPVERGERQEEIPGSQVSWGPRVQCRINPWQATRLRASNNIRPLPKNKFLFISVLSVLLTLSGRLFRNLFIQNVHFRNKDLLLQMKNIFAAYDHSLLCKFCNLLLTRRLHYVYFEVSPDET